MKKLIYLLCCVVSFSALAVEDWSLSSNKQAVFSEYQPYNDYIRYSFTSKLNENDKPIIVLLSDTRNCEQATFVPQQRVDLVNDVPVNSVVMCNNNGHTLWAPHTQQGMDFLDNELRTKDKVNLLGMTFSAKGYSETKEGIQTAL